MIARKEALWRLLLIWLIATVAVLVLMIAQLGAGALSDAKVGFGWFSTTIVAVPALLLGAYFADGTGENRRIERRGYQLAAVISLMYLAAAMGPFLLFMIWHKQPLVDLLTESALYLGPLHGMVTLALGRLIGHTAQERSAAGARANETR